MFQAAGLAACVFGSTWVRAQTPPPPAKDAPEPAVVPVPEPSVPSRELATKPAAPVPADEEPEVVVYLKDGRQFSGLLTKSKADQLVLRIGGVQLPFKTEEVERYQVLPPIFERYRSLKAAAGDEPEMILRVAEWLQSRERYELALTEVQRVLTMDATSPDAKRLKLVLEEQIVLKARAAKPKDDEDEQPEKAADGHKAERPKSFPVLTPAQINLIKVYEIDLRDEPRFMIPRETVEKLLEANAGNPLIPATQEGRDALMRKSASEILALMFDLRAREFYGDVQVFDQPKAIQFFRDGPARTWLNNSCATTQCHGGTEAGRLVLINRRPAADPSMYTNLLILTRFKTSKGQPLINWEDPDRSVLLQMGLPRKQAIFAHPEVLSGVSDADAWKPVFRGKTDPQFRAAVEWIKKMQQPRVEWPVDYTPLQPFEPPAKPARPQPPGQAAPTQKPASPPVPAPPEPKRR
jgi:hypothetical protein